MAGPVAGPRVDRRPRSARRGPPRPRNRPQTGSPRFRRGSRGGSGSPTRNPAVDPADGPARPRPVPAESWAQARGNVQVSWSPPGSVRPRPRGARHRAAWRTARHDHVTPMLDATSRSRIRPAMRRSAERNGARHAVVTDAPCQPAVGRPRDADAHGGSAGSSSSRGAVRAGRVVRPSTGTGTGTGPPPCPRRGVQGQAGYLLAMVPPGARSVVGAGRRRRPRVRAYSPAR